MDSVAVISYNFSSPFRNASVNTRQSYYGVTGTPTIKLDGNINVDAGTQYSTSYGILRNHFDSRKTVTSPLDIVVGVSYDSALRQGQTTIKLRNTTAGAVSGQLQVALTESHVYYPWQSLDSIQHVLRNMLPDASGEAVTIPANDSLTKTRSFTIDPSWVARNCELIAFVQNNSTKEAIQGGKAALVPAPRVAYLRYDGVYVAPGSNVHLVIHLENAGTGDAQNVSAMLTTTDPYVTVTAGSANYGTIPRRQERGPLTDFQISVAGGCPDPHIAIMNLEIVTANGSTLTTSFPVLATTHHGFSDSMENGENGWTHTGLNEQWHLTTHRSNSSSHSWYCGAEGSWQYTNENDARLITPYFVLGENTLVSFYHQYAVEADWDYCMVEIGNGSEFWQMLSDISGSNSSFQRVDYDLPGYQGQTVQVRFRFISDPATVAEGWYVDDFLGGPVSGIAEEANTPDVRLAVGHSLVTTQAAISYQIPAGMAGEIGVFDASGRCVAGLGGNLHGRGRLVWNLSDAQGRAVADGLYFVRITSGARSSAMRLVVAR